ncbi:MAG: hypothetical protein M4579_002152 [Chaenotheca gracillima]|nr:MAG: hypothetical protein M4579_002152 [Chaenotheca gracillima]
MASYGLPPAMAGPSKPTRRSAAVPIRAPDPTQSAAVSSQTPPNAPRPSTTANVGQQTAPSGWTGGIQTPQKEGMNTSGPLATNAAAMGNSMQGSMLLSYPKQVSTGLPRSSSPPKPFVPPGLQQSSNHGRHMQKASFSMLGDPDAWRPDVYARSFIPESLLAVNFSPAFVLHSESIPSIDYTEYVKAFSGTSFLRPLSPVNMPASPASSDLQPELDVILAPATYLAFFGKLLTEEYQSQAREADSYNLFKIPVVPHASIPNMYNLHVPGLREGIPKLALGDYLCLRQLRLDRYTSQPQGMGFWLQPGGGRDIGAVAPGFTGIQHNVSIWGIDKAKETVRIRMDGCVHQGLIFNVVFFAQPRDVHVSFRAVTDANSLLATEQHASAMKPTGQGGNQNSPEDVGEQDPGPDSTDTKRHGSRGTSGHKHNLNGISSSGSWMRKMLFPEPEDSIIQYSLPQGAFKQQWLDRNLNYEQMKAIDSIQQQNYGHIPYLISGPPGTGKTKSLVEAALQIFRSAMGNTSHILICAPSDSAADTLASRLRVGMSSPWDLLRLNHPSRTFAEVPADLLPYCHTENDMFSLPEFRQLMQYKIVVATCRDASLLVEARLTNRDLFSLENGLSRAIHSPEAPENTKLHWNALLIDEAAQGLEPEVLIPFTVVAPPDNGGKEVPSPVVVMAGDQYQLGPRAASRNPKLGTSLFERLFDRSVYRDHPSARKWGPAAGGKDALARPATWGALPMLRPAFTNLVRNYRSHASIIAIPSSLYYHDTLVPEATDTNLLESWEGWRGRGWPMLFACNGGADDRDVEGGGWHNIQEANKACDYARSLVASSLVEQRDICIMSPFRAQVNLLRHIIRAEPYKLYGVNIGPMEAFQGVESRCVIICTTRARERFLKEDHARGLGMIGEPKRFNVAVTRAKQGLIVIGNPWLLCQDPAWTALMEFCWRNGLWTAEDPKLEALTLASNGGNRVQPTSLWEPSRVEGIAQRMPRLEKILLLQAERPDEGNLDMAKLSATDEDKMWISGVEAESMFRQQWPEDGR